METKYRGRRRVVIRTGTPRSKNELTNDELTAIKKQAMRKLWKLRALAAINILVSVLVLVCVLSEPSDNLPLTLLCMAMLLTNLSVALVSSLR